jgi:hypothetical protein
MKCVRGGCYIGAEIGELMCSQDRSGRSSSRRSCFIFTIQAKEWLLKSSEFCKKVHTLPILHIYLLPAFLVISLYKLNVT